MNTATSRFTISTIAVAFCAILGLSAAETVQAQTSAPTVQRIEIVGKRIAPTVQRIEIIGQRQTPAVQRIEIVGQRLRSERVAVAPPKAPAL
ncbi:MAG: hypothetical protein V4792_07390 [Pseudomonadota bacterium]